MADHSAIEWTDATWQIVTGCDIVSPGCTNCYAMRLAGGRLQHHPSRAGLTKPSKAGHVWTGETRFNREWLRQPLEWKRPRTIFVAAHGDLFHEGVRHHLHDIYAVMALARQHQFQVLTKRPEAAQVFHHGKSRALTEQLVRRRMTAIDPASTERRMVWPLPNVWLGTSVENQKYAGRILDLLCTPAPIHYLSAEPLLGPLDLTRIEIPLPNGIPGRPGEFNALTGVVTRNPVSTFYIKEHELLVHGLTKLDWVIVGGESGPGARPMHPDWVRSLYDQCAAAGVPFFFKQWGGWARWEPRFPATDVVYLGHDATRHSNPGIGREPMVHVGKKLSGRLLAGLEHNGMPVHG